MNTTNPRSSFDEAMLTALAITLGPYLKRRRPVEPQSDDDRKLALSAAEAKRARKAAKRLADRGVL